MLLRDLLKNLDNFTDAEREVYVGKLVEVLTSTSTTAILSSQQGFRGDNLAEFITEQNNEIRIACRLEMSVMGEMLRDSENLEPLTEETVIG